VKDLYFDDHAWTVRYLVVDTGTWLPKRKVLISPESAGEPDWSAACIPLELTTKQVEGSPSVQSDKPVSRQHEQALSSYYDWSAYWIPGAVPAMGTMMPAGGPMVSAEGKAKPRSEPQGDPCLRSVKEVIGYHIHASDGEIGHVEDVIAETDDWIVRYLVIDTRNWLPGKKVLISPAWVDRFSWSEGEVHVLHSRQAIKDAPEFDPKAPINREYEVRLYDYYGAPKYWADRHC
jgi:hypothetical protein